MTDNFTNQEMWQVTQRATLECMAMLRVVMSNQIKIMKRLGMENDLEIDHGVFADLLHEVPEEGNTTALYIRALEPITGMLQRRAWEWKEMNTGDHLDDSDN